MRLCTTRNEKTLTFTRSTPHLYHIKPADRAYPSALPAHDARAAAVRRDRVVRGDHPDNRKAVPDNGHIGDATESTKYTRNTYLYIIVQAWYIFGY